MQNRIENFTKIYPQICFLYPSFHLCNIVLFKKIFLAYVTFYLLDEGISIFFTRMITKQCPIESCFFSLIQNHHGLYTKSFLQELIKPFCFTVFVNKLADALRTGSLFSSVCVYVFVYLPDLLIPFQY